MKLGERPAVAQSLADRVEFLLEPRDLVEADLMDLLRRQVEPGMTANEVAVIVAAAREAPDTHLGPGLRTIRAIDVGGQALDGRRD